MADRRCQLGAGLIGTVLAAAAAAALAALPPAAAAQAPCAVPAPSFGSARVLVERSTTRAGEPVQVGLELDVREAAFVRALRITAVDVATGARTDLDTPAAGSLVTGFVPAAPAVLRFEVTWEQGTCLSDDQREITAWDPRAVAGGRLEVAPALVPRTPRVSLQAVTRTRPGGARIGASVRVALDCRGRIAERPVGRAETIIRWTLDGTAPGPGSRALRAAAPSCTTFARRAVEQGTLSLAAEQAGAIAGLSSPGEQGLAVPGGTFPRPAPPLRVWLELRLGGRVLIATRARFTQRVVRARFCTGAGSGRSCRLRRHVETDVAPDAGPCPGMPEGRCRAFTRRLS